MTLFSFSIKISFRFKSQFNHNKSYSSLRCEQLSNRKKFMLIKPKQEILDKLNELGVGKVKNASLVLKNLRSKKKLPEKQNFLNFTLPPLQFFAGAKVLASIPKPTLPEVAVVGRSNVGKSRFLNAVLGAGAGQKSGASSVGAVVRHADRPGVTKQLNFFTCGSHFHLVDMPGYGFAYAKDEVRAEWATIIQTYLTSRPTLRLLYLLLDARHGIKTSDRQFMDMLTSQKVNFHVVLTKCDLVVRSILARRAVTVSEELAKSYPTAQKDIFFVSSASLSGVSSVRKHLLHSVGFLNSSSYISKKTIQSSFPLQTTKFSSLKRAPGHKLLKTKPLQETKLKNVAKPAKKITAKIPLQKLKENIFDV